MNVTTNKNFLQPTGFKVVINKEQSNIEYFAQSVTHPGSSVNAVEVGIPKLSQLPLLGDKITFSELSINLIIDEDMSGYKEMQTWMEDSIENYEGIEADITLVILTSHNNKNIEIRYKNCIPTNIGAFDLNSTSGDITYLTFDATFRFSHFEII